MEVGHPHSTLDGQTARNRLRPEGGSFILAEEDVHRWAPHFFQEFPGSGPLLRVWDACSGSRPSKDGRMMSRAPEMRLDSAESRRSSLTKHLNHKDWTAGPYISFTTSPSKIDGLAAMRTDRGNRGSQTLTVVDPSHRMRRGLPVLDVKAEMSHYEIYDPYGKENEYYTDHYVCLWQVTNEDIVGHWKWDDLARNKNWYHDTVMPAFRRFTAALSVSDITNSRMPVDTAEEEDMNELGCLFSKVSVNADNAVGHSITLDHDANGLDPDENDDEDRFDSGSDSDQNDYWDTDDEAEEANAADDLINILEGNWSG